MAINTSVEPFISAMLRQPDAKSSAQGIPRAIQGFAGSYLARKEIEESENRKPEAERASGFERFVGGFVNGPGRIAEGQEPFSVSKRSLNDQVAQLRGNLVAKAEEIGNLAPEDIPDWMQKNAGLAADPIGKALIDAAGRAYSTTTEAMVKAGRAKHLGDLASKYPNIDLTTPEGLSQAQRNESVKELYNRARWEGRTLNQLPDNWFNPDGTINEQFAVPGLGALPVSPRMQGGVVDPEIRTITDPETGQQITVYRTGPKSWARRPDTLSEPRATTVIDPNTKNPVTYVQTGANSFSRMPMSTGQQQVEQVGIKADDIFEKGRQLLPLINDRTTGTTGVLQRAIIDSGLGVLIPSAIDPMVPEADAVAREFASNVVRGLRSDGAIGVEEAKALFNEANTMKWVDERTGKSRLKAFVAGAVRRARESSLKLGRSINEKYLTLEEIGERGRMMEGEGATHEEAMAWAENAYRKSAEFFIREIERQIGQ